MCKEFIPNTQKPGNNTFTLRMAITPAALKKIWFLKIPMCNNWAMTWDFQQCGRCDQRRLRPACAYAQSDQSLCLSFEYCMSVKLLAEHHLEFLSIKGGGTASSESTLVNMLDYEAVYGEVHHTGDFCRHIFSDSQYPKLLNSAC